VSAVGVVAADADYEELETANGAMKPSAEELVSATTRPAVPEEQTDRMDTVVSRPCRGFWPAKVIFLTRIAALRKT
jgi:hypothetical protein